MSNISAIKDELKKMAKAAEYEQIRDVKASLEKISAELNAPAMSKKAFLGLDSEDESIIELIKAYIEENPEVAAALGLGTAGALAGGGIGALAGGDLTSALTGAGLGGLAGGTAGYMGGEDLMDVFAKINPEFTNELIKRAQLIKVAETLGISADELAKLIAEQGATEAQPVDEGQALIEQLANMKSAAANEAAVEEIIKTAAYNDALAEVQEELIKEAAYNDALTEVADELVKEAAYNDAVAEITAELEKKAALEYVASLIAKK